MKTKRLRLSKVIIFRRWQNKPYSVFNTIGKIILIACLPIVYVALSFKYSLAQNDTVSLSNIVINSHRSSVLNNQTAKIVNIITSEQISSMPRASLTELLQNSIGLDFQRRGFGDVQADLSIRGGNFDQALILINGTPIADKQTGHNALNIHIPVDLIERIEIVQGAATNIYGNGAYSGAINIITKNSSYRQISTIYGQHNLVDLSAIVSSKKITIASKYAHSDGYTTNTDFDTWGVFMKFNFSPEKTNSYFQIALSSNNFGAYNFYTPKFPYQYERVAKIYSNIHYEFGENKQHRFNLYLNSGYDNFHLFRETRNWWQRQQGYFIKNSNDTAKFAPGFYYKNHNYHLTNTFGINYSTRLQSSAGETFLGATIEMDTIVSNVLGNSRDTLSIGENIFFTKGDKRFIYNAFVNHTKKIDFLAVSAGLNYIYNSDFKSFWSFNFDITAKISYNLYAFGSFSQGVRFPTFTDMYYKDPSNEGTPTLKPETANNFDVGMKFFSKYIDFQTTLFYISGKNTIDWIKLDENDLKWKAMNYTQLQTTGFQFFTAIRTDKNYLKSLTIAYTYITQNKVDNDILSKYALNYLRHNLSIGTNHQIFSNLYMSVRYNFKLRNGNLKFLDATNTLVEKSFEPINLIDISLSYRLKKIEFFVKCQNLLNQKYYDLNFVELPGLWISGGIRLIF